MDSSSIKADIVISAMGSLTSSLCHPFRSILPINASPAMLMEFHNPLRFVNRIISNPRMVIRMASETTILAAEDHIDASFKNNQTAIAQRTLQIVKQH